MEPLIPSIFRTRFKILRVAVGTGSRSSPAFNIGGRRYHSLAKNVQSSGTAIRIPLKCRSFLLNSSYQPRSVHPTWTRQSSSKHENEKGRQVDSSVSNSEPKGPSSALKRQSDKLRSQVRSLLPAHENIYTIPNLLTFSRLIATPCIGYLILTDRHVLAVSLFVYAGVTDLLDGWIARKYNSQTVVGSVIDPLADKTLMTVLVGSLAAKGALPLPLAIIILGRDVSLAAAALYFRYASLPPPKTLARYWDFSLPSAEVHPTTVSKYNTFLQLVLIGLTVVQPIVANPGLLPGALQGGEIGFLSEAVAPMQYLVAATTLWSGLSYVFNQKAVTILGNDEKLKKKQGWRGRAIIGVFYSTFIVLAGYFVLNPPERVDDESHQEYGTKNNGDQQ